MDLIFANNNVSVVNDQTLWNKAITHKSGYDSLLGFDTDLLEENRNAWVTDQIGQNHGHEYNYRELYPTYKEYVRREIAGGVAQPNIDNAWNNALTAGNLPAMGAPVTYNHFGQNYFGLDNYENRQIGQQYYANQWINDNNLNPNGWQIRGWIGTPSNLVIR